MTAADLPEKGQRELEGSENMGEETPMAAAAVDTELYLEVRALAQALEGLIQTGRLCGVVLLAGADDTELVFQGIGQLQPGGVPMPRHALFRITSLTKPITAVGLLQLVEEGRIELDDPIARHLPEFSQLNAPPGQTITVRDLLRHTAGFRDLQDPAVDSLFANTGTVAEFSRELARLSLADRPGEAYRYGPAYEVVGRVIEVVTGESLDLFLERRLLRPLDMYDTCFVVPEDKRPRIPAIVRLDGESLTVAVPSGSEPAEGTLFLSGGGGMRSTAHDLYRFARMLANGGILNGVRVLQPETVSLMKRDQLGALSPWKERGLSWGFGVQIAGLRHPETQAFGWGGFFGGTWWASHESSLVVVVLAHQMPPGRPDLEGIVRALVTAPVKR